MNKMKFIVLSCIALGQVHGNAQVASVQPHHAPHHGHHGVEIVVVNAQLAIRDLLEFQDLYKDLQGKMEQLVQKIQNLEKRLQSTYQEFQMKSKMLSAEASERKQIEIAQLQSEIEIQKRNLQGKYDEELNVANEKILLKIQEFCQKMGWKIVIPGALYVAPELDKTQVVVDGLNKYYKKAQDAKKPRSKTQDQDRKQATV